MRTALLAPLDWALTGFVRGTWRVYTFYADHQAEQQALRERLMRFSLKRPS